MRALLDTNVLLSALIRPDGVPGRIVARAMDRDGTFEMVLSPAIIDELRRSARYPRVRKYLRLSDEQLAVRLAQLETLADAVEGKLVLVTSLRDPKDLMVLAAAVEGQADYVVTGDQDLLALGEYERIAIVTPRTFLDRLDEA